ncbi:putative ribonuclease H-like domain-containing protein [Tanacetum coccineum]
MVAYLEKSDENAEFHQIVDFISTCLINCALTVSPTIYSSYIEQFWNAATSKTVNSVKQIHAIVDGKAVVKDLPEPFNDTYETPSHTKKVFSNMARQKPQTALHQIETPPIASHEPQTEANIEKILPSPSIYQRKHRKTQKHKRATKVTELAKNSVPLDLGVDKAVHKKGGNSVARALATDASLVATQDIDNIIRTQTTAMPNPNESPFLEGHTFGSGEGRMEHTFELMDIVPPTPHDLPLRGGYTPGSDEGRLKLEELMVMCIKLSKQVLDLEKEKDAQAVEILKLKKKVKNLERQRKSSISHLKRRIYRQVKSSDDDLDEEDATKQGRTSDKTKPMFKNSDFDDLDDLVDEGMAFVQEKDAKNQVNIGANDTEAVNTADFDKYEGREAKEKGVAIKDVEDSFRHIRSITTLQPLPTIDPKDKGKGILQETKPMEKTKKKVQGDAHIERDAKISLRLQARIDTDYELAARMTQEEQEKYTIEERARLLAEFFKRRKKQLAADRAEAIRTKPPTKTQLRNLMMTYLKNMGEKEAQKPGKRLKRVAGSYATHKSPKKSKVMKSVKDVTEEEAAEYEQEKEELRLVQERFQDHPLEGHDLFLWGDLRMIFDPDEKVNHDGKWAKEEEEDSNEVHAVSFYPRTELVEPLKWKAPENRLKLSCVKPSKLKLKELPKRLEYAFLQENNQFPPVISSALSTTKKDRILKSLGNSGPGCPKEGRNDRKYSEEEVAETMAEIMEQYMSKTQADYGTGVARPKIEDKDNFELKGQFLKELGTNTFSGSNHEDANKHIEKVLNIIDLFYIPNITIDQVMLRAFPMFLTGAVSHWLRNEPTGSITTWDGLKIKFLNKYCPLARTAKKMEEINNFQQEPDENLYQA